jgi:hypothetical protein
MSANTAGAVTEGVLPLKDDSTVIECSGRGWDSDLDAWDPGYIGPRTEEEYEDARFIGGDCPKLGGNYDDMCADFVDEMVAECDQIDELEFYTWLQEDGYYAVNSEIVAWRTEALLNGEGDLQLTIHHDLGSGEDFRFGFSIDPNFNPQDCVAVDDTGNAEIIPVDGSNWVDQWSADEEDHSIYYLNSGAYQVHQGASANEFWYLTTDWLSGHGFAKFSSDEYNSRGTAYGHYDEDGDGPEFSEANNPSFLGVIDRENPDMDDYAGYAEQLGELATNWASEVTDVAGATYEGEPMFAHKIEDNSWRPIDLDPAGLDGWMEMHASYVRIHNDSDVTEGGRVYGDFQILYDALDSSSHIVVQGTFDIPELRTDPWAYPDLEEQLREESGMSFCEESTGLAAE